MKYFELQSSIIINFLFTIRNTNSIFDLLANEKNRISSDECINELAKNKPNFKLPLNKEFKHYYQEFELKINEQDIILVIYYKPSDDTFNVSIKLKSNEKSLLLSFTSLVYFEDINMKKVHSFTTICNAKSQTNIFKIEKFKSYSIENFHVNKKQTINLCVLLNLCNMHSAISTHLALNFRRNFQDNSIVKVNKQFLETLLKNDIIIKDNEDEVVIAVSNWCKYIVLI